MTKIEMEIREILSRNKDGSYQTQRDRSKLLRMFIQLLRQLGFNLDSIWQLKGRHINAMLEYWKESDVTAGTLKNRMSALRWLARKLGKAGIIPKSNRACGISDRSYMPERSRAITLDSQMLERIDDPHVAFSVQLQEAFGLRREEAMKFIVASADRGNHILLHGSWCKGGKTREIPILNSAQRDLLDRIHQFVGGGSLIPASKNYDEHKSVFERQTAIAGIGKTHGLRHQYAQSRYLELTGWKAPLAGGKSAKEMTPEERSIDLFARLTISRELGHERIQITIIYLGK